VKFNFLEKLNFSIGKAMSHIVGISEIVLWTADKEKAVQFYRDLLGLPVISPPEMPNIFLQAGEGHTGIPQMIVLVQKPADILVKPSGYQLHHLAFELPAEAFDAQEAALVVAGFAPRGGKHPVLASRTMYVDDPDGNEVEFISVIGG
jgi:catechol-2,3-dioxygenase